MRESAEAIVIGAGIVGASTAYWLTQFGLSDVLVLERAVPASGATGKSGALVRLHYPNPHETRLALESLRFFQEWEVRVGTPSPFVCTGFLQVVAPEDEQKLRANVAMQRALGAPVELVTAQEVAELEPWRDVAGLTVAAYEPESGYADPVAATLGLLHRVRQAGAKIRTGERVLAIEVEREQVIGVRTERGHIATGAVVLAVGPWANQLLAPLGLNYGLVPRRVQVAIFRWPSDLAPRHCCGIDTSVGMWYRPEGETSTLVGLEAGVVPADPDQYAETADAAFVPAARAAIARRYPELAHGIARGGWAGVVMQSPDGRPLIGPVPGYTGLFAMLGDSGTSFKTAPAVGRALAEWIVHGTPAQDLSPFRLTRFAEGQPWVDATDYARPHRTVSR
ncbi:FAD-binding oxidoreductase [Thermomicrobium sp. 4228-Ro]|uniref:NAD(P)/FAD-dependent oxidoreductase n=1 Tax=Thermomicrobium sp. 4228-Ro TaxID=2993937 RepID=UPI0022499DF3|nr:FAD-binding oxidoreductase [Thermomicrobium sp. 4228-Ro]MCX2726669.1 FAD-binding oxidoreductase [Thermomicrobium sp. 4228-Ro]